MPRVGDLPSSDHAQAFLRRPSAATGAAVVGDFVGRAVIVGAGLALFNRRRFDASLVRDALAGSAMIEVFVLGFTGKHL